MGRPKVPLDRKIVSFHFRVEPEIADRVYRYALRHNISAYKLLGNVVTRVFAQPVRTGPESSGYTQVGSSSASPVVAARSSTGVSSAALGVAAAGRRCMDPGVSD